MLKHIVSIEVITSKSDIDSNEIKTEISNLEKRLKEIHEALDITYRTHRANVAYHKKERQELLMRIKRAKKILDVRNTVTTDLLLKLKVNIS